MIAAHGGASRGYVLFLEKGRPCFGVRVGKSFAIADALTSCVGEWTHLAGVIGDRRVSLYVNGKLAGSIPMRQIITADPNDSMQIGRDVGSPVFEAVASHGFNGLIESVRIHSRALSPGDIARTAAEQP